MRTVSEFAVEEGERIPFVLTWYPSHRDPPPGGRRRARAGRHGDVLARLDRPAHERAAGGVARDRRALADRAEGAHLRADRRHRRRADDVAAGMDRQRPQLGLPLLLAARRDAHAARAAQRGLCRRGGAVAALAAARRRRRSGRPADHVRRRRRAAADRVRAAVAVRLRRVGSRCASATPRASSSSSTCTAR